MKRVHFALIIALFIFPALFSCTERSIVGLDPGNRCKTNADCLEGICEDGACVPSADGDMDPPIDGDGTEGENDAVEDGDSEPEISIDGDIEGDPDRDPDQESENSENESDADSDETPSCLPAMHLICEDATGETQPVTEANGISFGIVTGLAGPHTMACTVVNMPGGASDGCPFTLTAITITSDAATSGFEVSEPDWNSDHEFQMQPGDTLALDVSFVPDELDRFYSASLTFDYESSSNEVFSNVYPLSGAASEPRLCSAPEGELRFGMLPLGTESTIDLSLYNCSYLPVIIQDISFQGDASFALSSLPASLPLGLDNQNDEIGIGVSCSPDTTGSKQGVLTVSINGEPLRIPVSCYGIEDGCDAPARIDFGDVKPGDEVSKPVGITNLSSMPITLSTAEIVGNSAFSLEDVAGQTLPMVIEGGAYESFSVRFAPESLNTYDAELVFTFSENICNERRVILEGRSEGAAIGSNGPLVWEDIQVPPAETPDEKIAQWRVKKTLRVQNTGNQTLYIQDVFLEIPVNPEFSLPDFLAPVAVIPGGSWSIQIGYLPEQPGTDSARVVLCSNALNGDADNSCGADSGATMIELNAEAVLPKLQVEPLGGSCTMSDVPVGDSATCTITLKNTGTSGEVRLSDIEATAGSSAIAITKIEPDPSTWPEIGYALLSESANNVQIEVTFVPFAPQTYFRTIEITHNYRGAGDQYPVYAFSVVGMTGSSGDNLAPIARFSVNGIRGQQVTVSADEAVLLDGSLSYDPDPDDTIANYTWTIDGVVSTAQEAEKSVSFTPGKHNVYLRVADNMGAQSTLAYTEVNAVSNRPPVAVATSCVEQHTTLTAEAGEELCFDSSGSSDPDGSILARRWTVSAVGQTDYDIGYDTQATHRFEQAGSYEVQIRVQDNSGVWSPEPGVVYVEITPPSRLKVELVWTGLGDVDLSGPSLPEGCGSVTRTQPSADGVTPEIVEISELCSAQQSLTFTSTFVTPQESCHTEEVCTHYESDCERCGCYCPPFCQLLRICCSSCDLCHDETVCDPIPAELSYRVYVGDTPQASCTVSGASVRLDQKNDTHSLNLSFVDGRWECE